MAEPVENVANNMKKPLIFFAKSVNESITVHLVHKIIKKLTLKQCK